MYTAIQSIIIFFGYFIFKDSLTDKQINVGGRGSNSAYDAMHVLTC